MSLEGYAKAKEALDEYKSLKAQLGLPTRDVSNNVIEKQTKRS